MKKGIISKLANGYWQLWIKVDGKTTAMKAVAKATDKAADVMANCVKDYGLDQIGVKSTDIGPSTALTFGAIVWMQPGWQG